MITNIGTAVALAAAAEFVSERSLAERVREDLERDPGKLRSALRQKGTLPTTHDGYSNQYAVTVAEATLRSPYTIRHEPARVLTDYNFGKAESYGDTVELPHYRVSHGAGIGPSGFDPKLFATLREAQEFVSAQVARISNPLAFVREDRRYSRRGSGYITDGFEVVDATGCRLGYFAGKTDKARQSAKDSAAVATNAIRRALRG